MNAVLDVEELILQLRAPNITPEFEALHARLYEAKEQNPCDGGLLDSILKECDDAECISMWSDHMSAQRAATLSPRRLPSVCSGELT